MVLNSEQIQPLGMRAKNLSTKTLTKPSTKHPSPINAPNTIDSPRDILAKLAAAKEEVPF